MFNAFKYRHINAVNTVLYRCWINVAINAYMKQPLPNLLRYDKEHLAIRRIFSLVDMITNTKFSNCPNVFEIGVV